VSLPQFKAQKGKELQKISKMPRLLKKLMSKIEKKTRQRILSKILGKGLSNLLRKTNNTFLRT